MVGQHAQQNDVNPELMELISSICPLELPEVLPQRQQPETRARKRTAKSAAGQAGADAGQASKHAGQRPSATSTAPKVNTRRRNDVVNQRADWTICKEALAGKHTMAVLITG